VHYTLNVSTSKQENDVATGFFFITKIELNNGNNIKKD
jgi:hypothetical protein